MLKAPAADAMIHDFAGSAITYRVRFWIADFEMDEEAADQVRASIFYAFRRENIEIPFPIQVEMSKDLPVPDMDAGSPIGSSCWPRSVSSHRYRPMSGRRSRDG